MIRHIPNIITLGNLACGIIASVLVIDQQDVALATLFFVTALVLDFLDGFIARLLKVQSKIGKELDSLCDLVSFGFFPATIMYQLMNGAACREHCSGLISYPYFPYLAFIITLFSAYRLAKFNIDTRQSTDFYGIPTPANAAFFVSLHFIAEGSNWIAVYLTFPKVLLVIILLMSYLLIADFRLLSLKVNLQNKKKTYFQIGLLLSSILALIIFKWIGVPIIMILYVCLSTISNYLSKD